MEQDYIMRQINQIGRVLGKIFATILGLRKQGNVSESIEITNQTLKSELDFDIEELIAIYNNDLINFLIKEKNFNNNNIEKLADILYIIADEALKDKKEKIYEKCLVMYEYLDKFGDIFSLDRHMKIEQIKECLNTIS